jgi:hypothetical protein
MTVNVQGYKTGGKHGMGFTWWCCTTSADTVLVR